MTRAAVLHPFLKRPDERGGEVRTPAERLEEAAGLADAIELDVRLRELVSLSKRRPGTIFGKGKLKELGARFEAEEIEVIIIDGSVSPVQQRNLERDWKVKVLDRTGLILEIFGDRAATREGRLQVELAHLNYQRSRLVRSWTHLERQRGGLSFVGGPGETQIEADRRILAEKISRIKGQLEKVVKTRTLHRAKRQKAPYPIVALVGYANAGKSTLFNRMTQASVTAEDMLFATLDPTMRAIDMPGGQRIILSDTVGFISGLPTQLAAAFRATLEEVIEADLILHVRDISQASSSAQRQDVIGVLKNLGVNTDDPKTIVEAHNKIDMLSKEQCGALLTANARQEHPAIAISALTGQGIDDLYRAIRTFFDAGRETRQILVPASAGNAIAWLHAHGEVIMSEMAINDSPNLDMTVRMKAADWGRFEKEYNHLVEFIS